MASPSPRLAWLGQCVCHSRAHRGLVFSDLVCPLPPKLTPGFLESQECVFFTAGVTRASHLVAQSGCPVHTSWANTREGDWVDSGLALNRTQRRGPG